MTSRDVCASCASIDLRTVLDLGDAPLADEFPTEPRPDQPRYPLQLLHCQTCGLAQLGEVVDDELLWGGDYAFYSSSSATIRAYHEQYAAWLLTNYGRLMRTGPVVEVACNDGSLMQHLAAEKVNVVGVDPAIGPVKVARDRGLNVLHEPFGRSAAMALNAQQPKAAVIIANNVLAHVADLDDFIGGLYQLLHPDGLAIIEVQYLPDLLLGNDFPLLYHEHRYYFSLAALARTFATRGMAVRDAWLTEPQGGSLRVALGHSKLHSGPSPSVTDIRRQERWLSEPGAFDGLQGRAQRLRERLMQMLIAENLAGRKVAAYGASAKASTLFAWLGLNRSEPIDYGPDVHAGVDNAALVGWVVDTTPSKIGRFMPGTSIPVVERTKDQDWPDGPDTYLLTIYNYLGHVLRQEATWLGNPRHRMIVPVPIPKVI